MNTPSCSESILKFLLGILAFLLGIAVAIFLLFYIDASRVKYIQPFAIIMFGSCSVGFVSCVIRMITGVPGSGVMAARRIIGILPSIISTQSSTQTLSPRIEEHIFPYLMPNGRPRAHSLPTRLVGE